MMYEYDRTKIEITRTGKFIVLFYGGKMLVRYPEKEAKTILGGVFIAKEIGVRDERILSLKFGDELDEDENELNSLVCQIESDFEQLQMVLLNDSECGFVEFML